MEKHNERTRLLSTLLFAAGLLLAAALAIVAFWPDMEASLFDSSLTAEESIDRLSCPLLITEDETAAIKATFGNPFDRSVSFLVRTRISQGGVTLMREFSEVVELEAGASRQLQWEVTADDAAFGRMVLARVYAFRRNPMPSRDAYCGIMVLGVTGLSGDAIAGMALVASLLAIGVGGAYWLHLERPLSGRRRDVARAIGAMAALVLVALLLSLLGLWGAGLAIFVGIILLAAAMLEHFFLAR